MILTVFQILERKGDDGLHVEWVHFPGMEHGCLTKGSEEVKGEREAMMRGKDSAVVVQTVVVGVMRASIGYG
jgi:hypothetical protein